MRRNEIFEIIFDMNPDFVISECDETFFSETIEPNDVESIKERMKNFINDNKPMEQNTKQSILDKMSNMPEMLVATAYLYAKNYIYYGENVTKEEMSFAEDIRSGHPDGPLRDACDGTG